MKNTRTILEDANYTITITEGLRFGAMFSAIVNKKEGDRITGYVKNRTDVELITEMKSKLNLDYSILTHGIELTNRIAAIKNTF